VIYRWKSEGKKWEEVESMKKIEVLIDPSNIEQVKKALNKIGIQRMTISKVDEFESEKGHKEFYRADEYMINVTKEFKIELMATTDSMLRRIVQVIAKNTKNMGDREIFVFPVVKVIRLGAHPSHFARFDEKAINGHMEMDLAS
jgi:nitrogen regulatory protein PII